MSSSPWKNCCTFQQIYRPSAPKNLSSRATTGQSQWTETHTYKYLHTHLWQFPGCTSVTLRLVVPYLFTEIVMTVLNRKIRTKLVSRVQINKQFRISHYTHHWCGTTHPCHGVPNMTLIHQKSLVISDRCKVVPNNFHRWKVSHFLSQLTIRRLFAI
jgi:hypothetical protein